MKNGLNIPHILNILKYKNIEITIHIPVTIRQTLFHKIIKLIILNAAIILASFNILFVEEPSVLTLSLF